MCIPSDIGGRCIFGKIDLSRICTDIGKSILTNIGGHCAFGRIDRGTQDGINFYVEQKVPDEVVLLTQVVPLMFNL